MPELNPRVAFFLGSFGGGGIERITAHLAHNFVKLGVKVDLILNRADSTHLWQMPVETRVIDLNARNVYLSLPGLVRYIKKERPIALLATDHYLNEIALLAKQIAGVPLRLVVAEHNQLSKTARNATKLKIRLVPMFVRILYPWADAIIAVSQGVARDLAEIASLPLASIETIYNPVISSQMFEQAREPVEHPWFSSAEVPVILGVGKLEQQKDFPNLIRAFAKVRQVRPTRLVILGWGPDRPELEALIQAMGLQDDVDLPGHVQNPYAYMARSAVFVLSSAWEGLGVVLIEAMALGIPVVSTDCESGPSEILADGKYGYLTPVGDSDALADAILQVLSGRVKSIDSISLARFDVETATQKYLKILGVT
ncbi:glycosyltransferase [Chamaesiphon minutus]|uniref:Glycosyltransferase n=1 Tax=Chamaesiphon minutus (strain ATCC 27169 / PCC 6605) TaxID=1173020 RepID=K9UPS7_CHAP6|nr:glycosyltransferase [Chamaesiphon minutus]AFY96795.1 glycosyltransferase [Chamaesiphon minutus PCC 6605]